MKKIPIYLLLIIVLCMLSSYLKKNDTNSQPNEKTSEHIANSNNELGFQLFKRLANESDGNIFISPLSVWISLATLYNGTQGETKEEIAEVLQIAHLSENIVNDAVFHLLRNVAKGESEIEVALAHSLWLDEEMKFQDEFVQCAESFFQAKVQEINFSDAQAAQQINKWVAEATKGKITEMLEPPFAPNLIALIMNASYFKGDWTYPFQKERTERETFFAKETEIEVPFMFVEAEFFYLENDLFQAVVLPYGKGSMKMNVFLPHEGDDLERIFSELTSVNWKKWQESFEKMKGTVRFPKLTFEYETMLNDVLNDLGIKLAFQKENADFSAMVDNHEPVWLDEVKQKTFIEVHEEGTEAAAVTSVAVVSESQVMEEKFYMDVNRPFLFTISEESTGTILFIGRIMNPKVD